MSDIVTRIRDRFPKPEHSDDGLLANEAADEIERLRAALRQIRDRYPGTESDAAFYNAAVAMSCMANAALDERDK